MTTAGQLRTLPWWMALAAGLMALAGIRAGAGSVLDAAQIDFVSRWLPVPADSSRLPLVVGIGERTLREAGGWPLDRRVYADALRQLHALGASVVAFDVLFDRPSPDSEADLELAAALRETGSGVLATYLQPVARMDREMRLDRGMEVRDPVAPLRNSCRALGFVNIAGPSEEAGVIRSCRLVHREGSRRLESLALASARVAGYRGDPGEGKFFIRYVGSTRTGELPFIELADVLSGALERAAVEGRPVLVGATAASLGDVKETPLGAMPGVEVNASIVAGLLGSGFLRDLPPASAQAAALGSAIASAALLRAAPVAARACGLALIAGLVASGLAATFVGRIVAGPLAAGLLPLLSLLPRRAAGLSGDEVSHARQALDLGEPEQAARWIDRLPPGADRDILSAELLLASGEGASASRLVRSLDPGALDLESLYRLSLALEGAGLLEEARDLLAHLHRRDVTFRDAGERFLALDEKLLAGTVVLGPDQVRRALEARYAQVAPLGGGAGGLLYRCRDEAGEERAVKVLDPRLLSSREALARFRREAEILEALDHPGIVRFRGAVFGKLCTYEMDLVDGEPLSAWPAAERRPSEREARDWLRQAAAALESAHAAGVLHRDLKPSNLMLDRQGKIVVVDFGVARLEGAERLTREGAFLGTLRFAAPEQLRGEEPDARCDIYSLGAVIRDLTGDDLKGWALGGLVARMTAERPEDRPASMAAVLADEQMQG